MTSERPKSGTNTRFSGRHSLAALAIAATIAAFGGAAIYAATDGASGTPGWGGHGPGGMHGLAGRGGPGGPAPVAAVRGEFVAPRPPPP